eukprot:gnl/TRDRNA2_/TRDRNA2_61396_c0_seq1.p1 gnl/TRDRNA2_/TRDRNA2_61396_c0~~gnl/TRDRNA2_/TRDRNA2_61396_c0_seq1.p1  ORF type:complete len:352 (-),score=45.19 gnl/TRDRNA2_/TRDRNA2_61396_c0_seq1:42-1097(-)
MPSSPGLRPSSTRALGERLAGISPGQVSSSGIPTRQELKLRRSGPPGVTYVPGQIERTSSAPRASLSRNLTASMAQIADQDHVVEFHGMFTSPPFELGGKRGNVVTLSKKKSVHRGWRAVAVNGRPVEPSKIEEALEAAHRQMLQYTVTFRVGEAGPEQSNLKVVQDTCGEGDRLMRAESEFLVDEAAKEEQKKTEEAELQPRPAEEPKRLQMRQELEDGQQSAEEAERTPRAAEEQRRRSAEEATEEAECSAEGTTHGRAPEEAEGQHTERENAEAKLQAECTVANQHSETCLGLPQCETSRDSQQAPLQASTAETSSELVERKVGPCEKCRGPHHFDDCPWFPKPLRKK